MPCLGCLFLRSHPLRPGTLTYPVTRPSPLELSPLSGGLLLAPATAWLRGTPPRAHPRCNRDGLRNDTLTAMRSLRQKANRSEGGVGGGLSKGIGAASLMGGATGNRDTTGGVSRSPFAGLTFAPLLNAPGRQLWWLPVCFTSPTHTTNQYISPPQQPPLASPTTRLSR